MNYLEKAAEILTLLYLYGHESFTQNNVYQLTRLASLIFNLRGGEIPAVEAKILINQKLKTLKCANERTQYYDLPEAIRNVEWVKWWNDRLQFIKIK